MLKWLTWFQMPRIWLDYCEFLMNQGLITRTRRTFDRALRALPITQHHRIWPLYLKFVNMHNIPETAVRVYRRHLKVCGSMTFTWNCNQQLYHFLFCFFLFDLMNDDSYDKHGVHNDVIGFSCSRRKVSNLSSISSPSIASTRPPSDLLTSSTTKTSFRVRASLSIRCVDL